MTTDKLKVGDYGIITEESDKNFIGYIFKVTRIRDDGVIRIQGIYDTLETIISSERYNSEFILLSPAIKILYGVDL